MARTIEQTLADVRTLKLDDAAALETLRKALQSTRTGNGIVVAAIARRAMEHPLPALAGDLAAAFGSLLEEAVERDPQCRGKVAVARALYELGEWDERVFVVGLRVTQLEGWGKTRDDMAAELRGVCGLAHARFNREDALDVLATLLADKERIAREAAARGIGDTGRPDGAALLRYKLLVGEDDPEVLATCFESMLALARETSIPFLVGLLPNHDERAEAAALALGSARVESACDALVAWVDDCEPARRQRAGYLALALLRTDRANKHLLDAVRSRTRADALAAARALATFKADPAIVAALQKVAGELKDGATRKAIDALLV